MIFLLYYGAVFMKVKKMINFHGVLPFNIAIKQVDQIVNNSMTFLALTMYQELPFFF